MNINDLTTGNGEWLAATGPRAEVVISSRVRLARNLAAFPFMSKANRSQRNELHQTCKQRLLGLPGDWRLAYMDIDQAEELDRQILVERHLISRQHACGEGSRGVALSPDEGLSVMINEEDHLRLQVLRSGVQLRECWRVADSLDSALQQQLEFAYSGKFGFLTACPTNVGTGMRVSVMMHLPALKLTGDIEKIFRAAKDMHLAIRGLFGEGTEAVGDFYQISNQTTLGRSEEEILSEFSDEIIPRLITAELNARAILEQERPLTLDDKIGRAVGVLQNARLISTEETLYFLSHLRLGVAMKRVAGLDINLVNMLFLRTQPAHLQRLMGRAAEGDIRKAARAEFIRGKLKSKT